VRVLVSPLYYKPSVNAIFRGQRLQSSEHQSAKTSSPAPRRLVLQSRSLRWGMAPTSFRAVSPGASAVAHKEHGRRCFQSEDLPGALEAYDLALGALSPTDMVWPDVELFAYQCQANRALCLLRLGRHYDAAAACRAARASPSDAVDPVLREKVVARLLEALVTCGDGPLDARSEKSELLAVICELKLLGMFRKTAPRGHVETCLQLISQLAEPLDDTSDAVAAFRVAVRAWRERGHATAAEEGAALRWIAESPDTSMATVGAALSAHRPLDPRQVQKHTFPFWTQSLVNPKHRIARLLFRRVW